MRIITAAQLDSDPGRRVVIVGTGYAGMTATVALAHKMRASDNIEIVVVAPLPYQEALSELDLVAAGTPRPQWAELWHGDIFRGLNVSVVYERLDSVDVHSRRITLGSPDAPGGTISYWRLILATGAIPSMPPVPGLAENAQSMWSVHDALELQQRVDRRFKRAATIDDPDERRRAMSVCVIGGGATGVEIIGTLADVVPRMIARLGYDRSMVRLTLLEGRPDILYDLRPAERAKAVKRLQKMGVHVVVGEFLAELTPDTARTETGREIPATVSVWCGGAKADPDAVGWGLEADNSGRLVVDPAYRAKSCPEVYAVGDVAAFKDPQTNRVLPMLAQFAIRGAAHCAENIIAEARGREVVPFVPHMHGEFVSVGPRWGVGWMFGMPVSGWFAIVMKRLTYIMYWLQVGTFRLAWRRTLQMMRMHRY